MKNVLPRYLYFSRLERTGTASLLLITIAAWFYPAFVARFTPAMPLDFSAYEKAASEYYAALNQQEKPEPDAEPFFFDPNRADESDFRRLGLSPKVAASIIRYREKGGRFKKPVDFKKIYLLSEEDYERLEPWIKMDAQGGQRPVYASSKTEKQVYELFDFDPNVANEDILVQLGVPPRTAKSVVNYRSKGGVFRKKEDLKKIYTLPEEVYLRLEPYIRIETRSQETKAVTTPGFRSVDREAPASLDANLATVGDWQKIPGIGAWRAQQIVGYREKLGGFAGIAQLAEVKGLPDSVFQKIIPFVRITGGVFRKIDLNAATVETLDGHPYFSAKQARLIVHYREQHGPFKSVDDLLRLSAVVDAAWLEKVRGYLEL